MATLASLGAIKQPVTTGFTPIQRPVTTPAVVNIIQPTMIKMHYTEAPVQMQSIKRVVNRQPASRGPLWASDCGGEDGGAIVREL